MDIIIYVYLKNSVYKYTVLYIYSFKAFLPAESILKSSLEQATLFKLLFMI